MAPLVAPVSVVTLRVSLPAVDAIVGFAGTGVAVGIGLVVGVRVGGATAGVPATGVLFSAMAGRFVGEGRAVVVFRGGVEL
jgi:hypothetical protein